LRPEDLDEGERQRAEIWTRVMGYHRPISAWNPGKQSEHRERRMFREWPREGRSAAEDLVPPVGFCEPEMGGGRLGDHPSIPGA
jgi:hypothetical protein